MRRLASTNTGVMAEPLPGLCCCVFLVTKQVTAGSDGRIERKFSKNPSSLQCILLLWESFRSAKKRERVLAPNP